VRAAAETGEEKRSERVREMPSRAACGLVKADGPDGPDPDSFGPLKKLHRAREGIGVHLSESRNDGMFD
jgi:hypothetical protein